MNIHTKFDVGQIVYKFNILDSKPIIEIYKVNGFRIINKIQEIKNEYLIDLCDNEGNLVHPNQVHDEKDYVSEDVLFANLDDLLLCIKSVYLDVSHMSCSDISKRNDRIWNIDKISLQPSEPSHLPGVNEPNPYNPYNPYGPLASLGPIWCEDNNNTITFTAKSAVIKSI
jgi:hypothetical protein